MEKPKCLSDLHDNFLENKSSLNIKLLINKIFTRVILFISSDPSVNLPCEEQAKIFPHFTDRPQKVYVGI